ncbi:hypothetical protein [Streptomyces sp. DASNCL29]|uniref:hypothetical protein n=1 Tax=Streptomyces sp. DASNCL29 TaxID=2583819 RepID=UPI0019D2F631|nr:hypothetical protein [Streptomyces sp. DASNCL29]
MSVVTDLLHDKVIGEAERLQLRPARSWSLRLDTDWSMPCASRPTITITSRIASDGNRRPPP